MAKQFRNENENMIDDGFGMKKIERSPLGYLFSGKTLIKSVNECVAKQEVKSAEVAYKVYQNAKYFLERAVGLGVREATFYLSYLYEEGKGVPQNQGLADLWLAVGYILGEPKAKTYVERLESPLPSQIVEKAKLYASAIHKSTLQHKLYGIVSIQEAEKSVIEVQKADPSCTIKITPALVQLSNGSGVPKPEYTQDIKYWNKVAAEYNEGWTKTKTEYNSNAGHYNQSAYANDNTRYETKEAEPSAPDPEEGQPRRGYYEPEERKPSTPNKHYYNTPDPSAPPSYEESQAASSRSSTKNDSPPSAHGAHSSSSASSSSSSSSSVYNSSKLNLVSNYGNSGVVSAIPANVKLTDAVIDWHERNMTHAITKQPIKDKIGHIKKNYSDVIDYGTIRDAGDYAYDYTKADGITVTLTCRILYFTSTVRKGINFNLTFPLVKSDGSDVENGPASTAFQLYYNDLGKLMALTFPKGAIASTTDPKAPVIINGPEIHTLPTQSDRFIDLKNKVIANGGVINEITIDSNPMIMGHHDADVHVSGNCHGGCEVI